MLSKNQLKLITSLQQKKYRNTHGLFIVESIKVVNEFLNSNIELHSIYCLEDYKENIKDLNPVVIAEKELKKISSLKSPNNVLALFKIPESKKIEDKGLIVVLDTINDPGNLGTIIRLCDWFGVSQLICSNDTVDCYNTKVVQATMGSLTRVQINYTNLTDYLVKTQLPIYGAVMNGSNIYKVDLPKDAILIVGNEANGISNTIEKLLEKPITIPRFGTIQKTESLNVATATAILLNEFRKNY